MNGKNVVSFIVVLVVIALLAYITIADVTIGDINFPGVLDSEVGIRQGLDLVGGSIIVFEPDVEDTTTVSSEEVEVAEDIIRQRLDSRGYFDATISRQGETGIRVEIPNIDDPNEAVETIGRTAKLEFRDADGNVVMEGTKDYVINASYQYGPVTQNGSSEHYISLQFTEAGRAAFKTATENAVAQTSDSKNYIAIALDEDIISQPSVNTVIDDDGCIIHGSFTREEATTTANLIQSGQLPFSLKDTELRSVGPTLGEKALSTSLWAAFIGLILVMLFMLAVYRLPGLVADVSLVAYVAVVCLIMAGFFIGESDEAFRITLTLPGIAGVILSIGMAVDANVVIFERIKDELRAGKTVGAAVDAGFKRAITAIIDSNITTLIAAVVLYFFGTGTIKGFATTLFIGVVISLLTAVTLTKFLLRQIVGFGVKNPALYGVSKRRDA
ncbi:MAG: protein translocase subunit SecD [Clostridia bacterium]|nr:protein translocase subunit SecD [Clostridia bacterium]